MKRKFALKFSEKMHRFVFAREIVKSHPIMDIINSICKTYTAKSTALKHNRGRRFPRGKKMESFSKSLDSSWSDQRCLVFYFHTEIYPEAKNFDSYLRFNNFFTLLINMILFYFFIKKRYRLGEDTIIFNIRKRIYEEMQIVKSDFPQDLILIKSSLL